MEIPRIFVAASPKGDSWQLVREIKPNAKGTLLLHILKGDRTIVIEDDYIFNRLVHIIEGKEGEDEHASTSETA